jgi:hypothetical protein
MVAMSGILVSVRGIVSSCGCEPLLVEFGLDFVEPRGFDPDSALVKDEVAGDRVRDETTFADRLMTEVDGTHQ